MTALLFPGQGSQHKGMGQALFGKHRALTKRCSDILEYSIEELCLHDPEGKLDNTQFSQPAIFFVNALAYLEEKEKNQSFAYALGHSLGEYNALHAADVFDLETGIRLVKKRGELMAQAVAGGMLAVLGKSLKEVETLLKELDSSDIDIANYNTPNQLVLSGPVETIKKIGAICNEKGIKAVQLKVGGAFHSRYMQFVESEFQDFLNVFQFSAPKVPVISNYTAQEHDVSNLKLNLVKQISHQVRWVDSIAYLLGKGVADFKEINSFILTKMVKEIKNYHPPLTKPQGEIKQPLRFSAHSLGNAKFQDLLKVKYNYVAGAMYRGIASADMVIQLARNGILSFFGAGGLSNQELESNLERLSKELKKEHPYGVNFLCNYLDPNSEFELAQTLIRHQITMIEASAFLTITPALAYYAIKGMEHDPKTGEVQNRHRIFAKLSRPELAQSFMSPVPEKILNGLLETKKITALEAQLAKKLPLSQFVCVEADSGGHTDGGSLITLLPAFLKVRNDMAPAYKVPIFVGAAGGIGTPDTIAAAFILGADYVQTGSVNQCTIESGTSAKVKELLQNIDVTDTDYAPAGDMFEIGAKVQVLKKGVLFPPRANKLRHLYQLFSSLDEIPLSIRSVIEEKVFRITFHDIFREAKEYFESKNMHNEIESALQNPKHKMALVFRWYLGKTNQWAIQGDLERVIDYQVHTGPSLGAFNRWVKGTNLERWQNRHVHEIAKLLMEAAADIKNQKFQLV